MKRWTAGSRPISLSLRDATAPANRAVGSERKKGGSTIRPGRTPIPGRGKNPCRSGPSHALPCPLAHIPGKPPPCFFSLLSLSHELPLFFWAPLSSVSALTLKRMQEPACQNPAPGIPQIRHLGSHRLSSLRMGAYEAVSPSAGLLLLSHAVYPRDTRRRGSQIRPERSATLALNDRIINGTYYSVLAGCWRPTALIPHVGKYYLLRGRGGFVM